MNNNEKKIPWISLVVASVLFVTAGTMFWQKYFDKDHSTQEISADEIEAAEKEDQGVEDSETANSDIESELPVIEEDIQAQNVEEPQMDESSEPSYQNADASGEDYADEIDHPAEPEWNTAQLGENYEEPSADTPAPIQGGDESESEWTEPLEEDEELSTEE